MWLVRMRSVLRHAGDVAGRSGAASVVAVVVRERTGRDG